MITTFERLAKVVKKEAAPANWIEKAFADLVSAIGSVLPSVSNSDRGKFLGVNTSNNNLGWKTIRQVPDVENADKGKYLHANGDTGALEWSEAGGLPAVTGADEGKVLTVNSSGVWDAETPSGGGGVEYYDVTISSTDGSAYTADKTWEEISAAATAGKLIVLYDEYNFMGPAIATPSFSGTTLSEVKASAFHFDAVDGFLADIMSVYWNDRFSQMEVFANYKTLTVSS